MSEVVTFPTNGLLSKWGFEDGDMLFDVFLRLEERFGVRHDGDDSAVLVRAVREYVLPALEQEVDVVEIQTHHNPIRARTVNGVTVDWFADSDIRLTPATVDVPVDVLWKWYLETSAGDDE